MANSASISAQIGKIMEQYELEVKLIAQDAAKQAASETRRMIKNTAPKKTGEYARSWSVKKGKDSYTVYSRKPSLTHLLEFGHVTKNGTGRTFPRTPAHPHIKKAEEFGNDRFLELVEQEVSLL